jgi:hypothetical protein
MSGKSPGSVSRRAMLKRIGAGAAVAWSAPVITSIRTPAFAQYPGTGCIELPQAGTVTATVTSKSALHTLEFGLQSPDQVVVCSACGGGESAVLGPYAAGTDLVFYMKDYGGGCDGGCSPPVVYLCTDACHSTVTQTGPTTWTICFKDSACGCGGYPCDVANLNLCAEVSLS